MGSPRFNFQTVNVVSYRKEVKNMVDQILNFGLKFAKLGAVVIITLSLLSKSVETFQISLSDGDYEISATFYEK